MRQSTLAFGQKSAPILPKADSAAPSSLSSSQHQTEKGSSKDIARHPHTAKVSSSSSQSQSLFANGNSTGNSEKAKQQYDSTGASNSSAPKVTKRMLVAEPFRARKRAQVLDDPWPGKGESHVQPATEGLSTWHDVDGPADGTLERQRSSGSGNVNVEADYTSPTPWSWVPTKKTLFELLDVQVSKKDASEYVQECVDLRNWTSSSQTLPAAIERIHALCLSEQNGPSSISSRPADLHRPQRSDDILGNESQARYLRDWLKALEVTSHPSMAAQRANGDGQAGPSNIGSASSQMHRQIIRRAQRRRQKAANHDSMDDFLVGDNEEEEAWFDQFRKEQSPPPLFDATQAVLDDGVLDFANTSYLTNVIVLVGPSGCGKTASVYACAQELGFEVFELFPGMGKRSGRDVVSLVGDLCRNHMVSSGGTGGGAFQGKQGAATVPSFFAQKKKSQEGAKQENPPSLPGKPRQSLVLFEEVDILYEEDKGFWPALIELAADSRRPIILTCNDLSGLPLADLAIQQILHFEPVPSTLAVPYLQLLFAALKKIHLTEAFVRRVYEDALHVQSSMQHDDRVALKSSGLLPISTTLRYPEGQRADLRQALTQLDFAGRSPGCVPIRVQKAEAQVAGSALSLRQHIARAERCSAGDLIGKRSHARDVELLEPDHYQASSDDVVCSTSTALLKQLPRGDEKVAAEVGIEDELLQTLCPDAGGEQDVERSLRLRKSRLETSRTIDAICEGQKVNLQSRIASEETVIEYAAFVHKMIKIDDAEEMAHQCYVSHLLQEARQNQIRTDEPEFGEEEGKVNLVPSGGVTGSLRRQSSRLLLQRDDDGRVLLRRKEPDFCRYMDLGEPMLAEARNLAPCLDW